MHNQPRRLIIGISGASGAMYGIRMLEILRETPVETHLIISRAAQVTIPAETPYSMKDVTALADVTHPVQDIAASISSGSFPTEGMVIAPCSVKTLAEIATGVTQSLMTRAADVVLKERRRLVLMVRETPLTTVHIRNMLTISEMGGIIAPPLPAHYNKPAGVEDIVNHSVGRVLDLFGIDAGELKRWRGLAA